MSNRNTHVAVGALAGATHAFARVGTLCRENKSLDQLVEVLGGVAGGYIGARLPDLFDPPTHPGHRGLAHGVIPVAGATALWRANIDGWQEALRAKSLKHEHAAEQAGDPLERLLHAMAALLYRLTAGAVAGVGAGYLSHVLLDAFTPAGLPAVA